MPQEKSQGISILIINFFKRYQGNKKELDTNFIKPIMEGKKMSEEIKTELVEKAELDKDQIKQIATDATAAERERCGNIILLASQFKQYEGIDDLLATALKGNLSEDKALISFQQCALEARRKATPEPVSGNAEDNVETTIEDDTELSVEDRAKNQFEKNKKLRDEFGTVGAYTAYLRNLEKGNIKIKSS